MADMKYNTNHFDSQVGTFNLQLGITLMVSMYTIIYIILYLKIKMLLNPHNQDLKNLHFKFTQFTQFGSTLMVSIYIFYISNQFGIG